MVSRDCKTPGPRGPLRGVAGANADTALVLGAAVGADGQPSDALRRRALHAARLFAGGRVGFIIASGGPPGAALSEAAAIARLLIEAGVPRAAIATETRAATTAENIDFCLPLLRARGGRAILVTDRFHASRAAMVARAAGLEAILSCPPPDAAGPLRRARRWLREKLATLVYRVRIWRGH